MSRTAPFQSCFEGQGKTTSAGALTSVLLHSIPAHAPLSWSRGGADKSVLEALQSLAPLERETVS